MAKTILILLTVCLGVAGLVWLCLLAIGLEAMSEEEWEVIDGGNSE